MTSFLLNSNGLILYKNEHLERIKRSVTWCFQKEIELDLEEIVKKYRSDYDQKIKLIFFLLEGKIVYKVIHQPFSKLEINSFRVIVKSENNQIPNYIKRDDYGFALQQKRFHQLSRYEDFLWVSKDQKCQNTTFGNILFYDEESGFSSPRIDEGALLGISIQKFQDFARLENFAFSFKDISLESTKRMDGVFMINSVSGLIPIFEVKEVGSYRSQKVFEQYEKKWLEFLNTNFR